MQTTENFSVKSEAYNFTICHGSMVNETCGVNIIAFSQSALIS